LVDAEEDEVEVLPADGRLLAAVAENDAADAVDDLSGVLL
jgi:hypothetical protein